MNRREFLGGAGASLWGRGRGVPSLSAAKEHRVRPPDPGWPSAESWRRLRDAVDGNLLPGESPLDACQSSPGSEDCTRLFSSLKNPFFIGESPGLTQTLGWIDAWKTRPSAWVVAARNAKEVAAAVNFARRYHLRLVVRGGGHSYQGTSNAPDSLLIWTRHMQDIRIEESFVPRGCESSHVPRRAVTVESGAIWLQAYDAVTTRGGSYVQGGGCTTVGVAGLIQSGGFGSFSKYFGTAASSLLEAEVVTADGQIRTVNACTDPELFWALKGGGGGTFAVVCRLTLALHDLPELAGGAIFTVRAPSDDAYRRLIGRFIALYRESLLNPHWGEQVHLTPGNRLEISMVHAGLETEQVRRIWQPFLDWVAGSSGGCTIEAEPVIGSMPMRRWWDADWRREEHQDVFTRDPRPGAPAGNVWWDGDSGQVGWVVWGFESLWMPASLLRDDPGERLAGALFAASRHHEVQLHFNKGLAGAPAGVIEAARETAMNPAVLDAFALAIVAAGQGPAYPGISGREPDLARGRAGADAVHRAMNELRALAPGGGAYVSESNFYEAGFERSYWGGSYGRLAAIKERYDPDGLFFVHNGVGSGQWSADGFTRL